jgi:hypothetical protein
MRIALALSMILAAIGPAGGSQAADNGSVRVLQWKSLHCTNAATIGGIVENTLRAPVHVSMWIDREASSGDWERFVDDIFADHPTKTVRVLKVPAGTRQEVMWRTPSWRPDGRLPNGRYRLMIQYSPRWGPPYRMASVPFTVSPAGCQVPSERAVDVGTLVSHARSFNGQEVIVTADLLAGEGVIINVFQEPKGSDPLQVWVDLTAVKPSALFRDAMTLMKKGTVRATLRAKFFGSQDFEFGHMNCCRFRLDVSELLAVAPVTKSR